MKHILPATVIEKVWVVCQLFTLWWLLKTGRENGQAGPFYIGTSCLNILQSKTSFQVQVESYCSKNHKFKINQSETSSYLNVFCWNTSTLQHSKFQILISNLTRIVDDQKWKPAMPDVASSLNIVIHSIMFIYRHKETLEIMILEAWR